MLIIKIDPLVAILSIVPFLVMSNDANDHCFPAESPLSQVSKP